MEKETMQQAFERRRKEEQQKEIAKQQCLQQFNREHIIINKKKLAQFILISLISLAFIYGFFKIIKITIEYNNKMLERCELNHSKKYCLARL